MSPRSSALPRSIEVAPAPAWRLLWLWIPLLLVAGLMVGTALDAPERSHTELMITLPFLAVLAAVLTWAYSRRRIVLHEDSLEVLSTFYRKRVPVSAMRLEEARIVDFAEHGRYKPSIKTNGYGVPGFQSGHYRMADRSKAFCLITDSSRVLYLPLRDGSALVISPERPRVLLDALQALAARPPAH